MDLISRQSAIDAVGSMLRRKFGIGGDLAEITLAGLPAAEPEHKTGHWKLDWKHNKATCSECGHAFRDAFDIDDFDNFCRHCGAKMEGK